jgi:hypothetical protein
MSPSLTLASDIHVFPCPNCNETINTSMQLCKYCNTPIDHAAAEAAAAETSRISQACSDASYLRVMLGLLLPFFGLIFIPLLSLIGAAGFWFLKIAIPVMLIRWWVKFGKIKTTDPDFSKARGTTYLVAGIWVLVFALTFPFHLH